MEKLCETLFKLLGRLKDNEPFFERLNLKNSIYPFNDYEFITSTLLGMGLLALEDYYQLRNEYIARNRFLKAFELSSPKTFGETWAQEHVRECAPLLERPTKAKDPAYNGSYDFLLDDRIRVEVKASRAVDVQSSQPLPVKALSLDSDKTFVMNFQQMKPACCDVFVWVGVWRDATRYWTLASHEVRNSPFFFGAGRRALADGNILLRPENIGAFDHYESKAATLVFSIRAAYARKLKHDLKRTLSSIPAADKTTAPPGHGLGILLPNDRRNT